MGRRTHPEHRRAVTPYSADRRLRAAHAEEPLPPAPVRITSLRFRVLRPRCKRVGVQHSARRHVEQHFAFGLSSVDDDVLVFHSASEASRKGVRHSGSGQDRDSRAGDDLALDLAECRDRSARPQHPASSARPAGQGRRAHAAEHLPPQRRSDPAQHLPRARFHLRHGHVSVGHHAADGAEPRRAAWGGFSQPPARSGPGDDQAGPDALEPADRLAGLPAVRWPFGGGFQHHGVRRRRWSRRRSAGWRRPAGPWAPRARPSSPAGWPRAPSRWRSSARAGGLRGSRRTRGLRRASKTGVPCSTSSSSLISESAARVLLDAGGRERVHEVHHVHVTDRSPRAIDHIIIAGT